MCVCVHAFNTWLGVIENAVEAQKESHRQLAFEAEVASPQRQNPDFSFPDTKHSPIELCRKCKKIRPFYCFGSLHQWISLQTGFIVCHCNIVLDTITRGDQLVQQLNLISLRISVPHISSHHAGADPGFWSGQERGVPDLTIKINRSKHISPDFGDPHQVS